MGIPVEGQCNRVTKSTDWTKINMEASPQCTVTALKPVVMFFIGICTRNLFHGLTDVKVPCTTLCNATASTCYLL